MQIDTLLHLFECAEIGCADIHKLIEMIRAGATEQECMDFINKALRASKSESPFSKPWGSFFEAYELKLPETK